jgi:hypothetical protein
MTRRRLILLAFLAAGLAAVAGNLTGRWRSSGQPAADQPASSLYIDSRDLDIGEVWEQDRLVRRIRVYNRGSEPARVTTLAGSCACVGPGSVSETIPPGESREIPVELDLEATCSAAGPSYIRQVKLPLPLSVEPAVAGRPWQIRGRVRSALAVPVRLIDFGRMPPHSPPRSRVIPVRALTGLSDLSVSVDQPYVSAGLKPSGPGTWELTVRTIPALPPMRSSASVELHAVTTHGEPVPPVRVSVEFEVLGDIQPDTPDVLLGTCQVGGSAEGRFILASFSGRPFQVTGWKCEPGGHFDLAQETATGVEYSFVVRHRVTAPGDTGGTIIVTGRDAAGSPFEITLRVYCFGVNPS